MSTSPQPRPSPAEAEHARQLAIVGLAQPRLRLLTCDPQPPPEPTAETARVDAAAEALLVAASWESAALEFEARGLRRAAARCRDRAAAALAAGGSAP